jgi:hypothetical protein
MVAPAVEGIDLFKIAGRSISGWIPSLKTGTTVRQPFCSQLEHYSGTFLGGGEGKLKKSLKKKERDLHESLKRGSSQF